MKRLMIYISALLSFLMVFSCREELQTPDYIRLSRTSYTFSDGKDSLDIRVECSGEWSASVEGDWISINRIGEDTLRVLVEVNEDMESRSGRVEFKYKDCAASFSAEQFGITYKGRFVEISDNSNTKASISKNGRYIGLMKSVVDDNGEMGVSPFLIDTESGEMISFEEINGDYQINAVGSDASIVLYISNEDKTMLLKDGKLNEIKIPEGYRSQQVYSMSLDCSIMVGFCQNISTRKYHPVKWTNGEPEILESPDVNIYGAESYGGTMARGCSDDGSVIYGSEWSGMRHPLVYWKGGKMFYSGYDYSEKVIINSPIYGEYEEVCAMTVDASNTNISPDGRYITSTYNDYRDNGSGSMEEYNYVAVIDTQTGVQILLDDSMTGLSSVAGITITDEGTIFGATPSKGCSAGYVIDLASGFSVPLDQWFLEKYGVHLSYDRIVEYIGMDENIFFGWRTIDLGMGSVLKYWYYKVDDNK